MDKSFNHKQKTLLIGICAITTVMMFYFGFNYLKGINVFSKSDTYYITFDNIQGVDRSTKVLVNGYRVGNVRRINFDYQDYSGAIVELAINRSLKIPVGTKAIIKNNPLGGGAIVLVLPDVYEDYIAKRDTLAGDQARDLMASVTDELIPNLNTAILSIDSLVGSVDGIVKSPDVANTLAQLNAATRSIQGSTSKFDRMMDGQLPKILGSVERSTQSLEQVTGKVANTNIEKVLTDFTNVVADLKEFSSKLSNEDSSLGLLLNDKGLYEKLDAASLSADSLLRDIKKNPKRYVSFSVF